MIKKYDIIYSIGRDCACAMYMKRADLRLCSGPFDWLTHGDFSDRMNLLLSDFKDFMNSNYFRPLKKNENMFNDEACDYYENFRVKTYFFHDFPAGVPFDTSFPQVKKKYERRISRFWGNIKTNDKVLLIWFFHGNETDNKEIIKFCQLFCKKIGKTVDFLIIENNKHQKEPKEEELAKNITKWTLRTAGVSENESPTLGNELQVQPIFNQYALIVPFGALLKRYSIKWLTKFACCFMPVRRWRKKIKNWGRNFV